MWPLTVKLSMPLPSSRTGSRIQAWTPSTWTMVRLFRALVSRANFSTSQRAPVSLFTIMQATRMVARSTRSSSRSTSRLPSAAGGTNSTCQPEPASASSGRRTLGCSNPEQRIFLPKVRLRAPPSRARLFPSLPQEVK